MTLKPKKNVDDIWPMTGKRVLVRVDFNVPIKDGVILNDFRIRSALPTIRSIIDQDGICILMSHLGRPQGVAWADMQQEADRKRALATWEKERGTGKTSFFALLSNNDKMAILRQSSAKDKVTDGMKATGQGKTALFTSLPDEEKRKLLHDFTGSNKTQSEFPQLRQYEGFEEEHSLRPVAEHLSTLLNRTVIFAEDCMNAADVIAKLKPGDTAVLENVRFYSDESAKSEKLRSVMASRLASYGDYFVSDAFGTAHRDSATMTGIPRVLGHGAAGYLMDREINYFSRVLGNPARPLVAIVGGAKVSDKILLLENMLRSIDKLIIGGAMAYTFLKAQGIEIGRSFSQAGQSFTDKYGEKKDIIALANGLLETAARRNVEVYLPIDHVCNTAVAPTDTPLITNDAHVPANYMALDIGPKTTEIYCKVIGQCHSAIWNGPMGVFEIPTYSNGTFSVAKAMGDGTQEHALLSIVGGGDSASAAENCGQASRMSHVSTGGGASLNLLEGCILPGIAVLDDKEDN